MRIDKATAGAIADFLEGAPADPGTVSRWVSVLRQDASLRSERSGVAARARWDATDDRTAATAPGRATFMQRFASDEERTAYFRTLAAKSAATRRAKRERP